MTKTSQPWPNLANRIGAMLARSWPELAGPAIPGVWWTGSRIWRMAYDLDVMPIGRAPRTGGYEAALREMILSCRREERAPLLLDVTAVEPEPDLDPSPDWDVFATSAVAAELLCSRLQLGRHPARRCHEKALQGSVDIAHTTFSEPAQNGYKAGWSYATPRGDVDLWLSPGGAYDEISTYPAESHAHCRMAFSFTEGLLVLPNETAP